MVYKTKGFIHKDVYANLSKEIETHLITRKDAITRKLGIPFGYNVKMDKDKYVVRYQFTSQSISSEKDCHHGNDI